MSPSEGHPKHVPDEQRPSADQDAKEYGGNQPTGFDHFGTSFLHQFR